MYEEAAYRESKADFSDAVIVELCRETGCSKTLTFDPNTAAHLGREAVASRTADRRCLRSHGRLAPGMDHSSSRAAPAISQASQGPWVLASWRHRNPFPSCLLSCRSVSVQS